MESWCLVAGAAMAMGSRERRVVTLILGESAKSRDGRMGGERYIYGLHDAALPGGQHVGLKGRAGRVDADESIRKNRPRMTTT